MQRLELFSTPLLVHPRSIDAALAQRLAARFVAQSHAEPGVQRSNMGGWHSAPDLSTRDDPDLRALMDAIWAGVRTSVDALGASRSAGVGQSYRFGIQAWAMVMRAGDYIVPHHHAAAPLSGVLYLDAGEPATEIHPKSGRLTFIDPRNGIAPADGLDLFPALFEVRPRTASMAVFPGFVQHFVHTYQGGRPRVSVSFNVRLTPMIAGVAPPGSANQSSDHSPSMGP